MSHSARHLHRYTYADYLAHEEGSQDKHEFLDGEIYAMAGGTPDHAAVGIAVAAVLSDRLRDGRCRIFSSDLRVRVLATGLATYPDVTVVCGPLEIDPESRVTIVNPTMVVEVLSDGTEEYDRGEKLDHYRQIPSLRACMLVSQKRPAIDLVAKTAAGSWSQVSAGAGDKLRIEALGCDIDVDEVYRRAGLAGRGAC